jgi:cob(I)alamin adenosyltransferase
MVTLSKIYTRGGDKGATSLVTGERVAKNDARIAAFGTVDETNACIGLARIETARAGRDRLDAMLARIQNDLFDLGADLATPAGAGKKSAGALRIADSQVERLEQDIDALNESLKPLDSFVLPGGTPAAAALHLARTVCRRAERLVVALAATGEDAVNEPALRYINRLSDFLFVAARHVNDGGAGDILWVPGENR